ncbi:hypothetical protein hmeg3_21340 [Herbaspirillum sp. meg3]|uniref:MaoC/PaaZ C-terminal domain-containing protein n=1 Tax=Herbaspirillum sp. meg3 TaxID=2025949 RepID=UPI000B98A4A2|nr:MaoC/PaaZ C-terminal domain-containing protein [Herbaspirillum sp. meg3]ASU40589.1 hypothetical protein hmeg3_21340 [Herbaspirillum sp. meg3]
MKKDRALALGAEALSITAVIGKKTFGGMDQAAFASFSQDRNPLHMDPVKARRFLSGAQVVHGVNLLLTALDMLVAGDCRLTEINRVACEFKVAVNLGEEVTYVLEELSADRIVIHGYLTSVVCTKITLFFGEPRTIDATSPVGRQTIEVGGLAEPLNLSEQECSQFSANLTWNDRTADQVCSIYPALSAAYGVNFCQAFATLSYIVGMVCPGLNSMFLSLDVKIAECWRSTRQLSFHVSKFEDRIKLIDMQVDDGPLFGVIKAFRRPEPVRQPGLDELTAFVGESEFRAMDSFVIGGSRGLGELTGKIIATGGGKVTLGYAIGKDDAERVRDEINKRFSGVCDIRRIDINQIGDAAAMLATKDAVFYFPTPVISKKINTIFSQDVFQKFLEFYVYAFSALCYRLEALATKRIRVFYPSTVFVEDRPNGMTEYAMAKAAAELMIADMNRVLNHVKIHVVRLPRLKSDQTNSIFQVKTEHNIDYLLSAVRGTAAL